VQAAIKVSFMAPHDATYRRVHRQFAATGTQAPLPSLTVRVFMQPTSKAGLKLSIATAVTVHPLATRFVIFLRANVGGARRRTTGASSREPVKCRAQAICQCPILDGRRAKKDQRN